MTTRTWNGNPEDLNPHRLQDEIGRAIYLYGVEIERELAYIRDISPNVRAYYALTFAMVSPRCPFDKNVRVTPELVRQMMSGAPADALEHILRQHGIGLAVQKSRNLKLAQTYLHNFLPDRAMLLGLRGVGPKVASMALALYDDRLPVFTLDTHMIRGIGGLDGKSWTVGDKGYREMEAFALEVAGGFDASPFLVQWALWGEYSGKGFMSHLGIFGL